MPLPTPPLCLVPSSSSCPLVQSSHSTHSSLFGSMSPSSNLFPPCAAAQDHYSARPLQQHYAQAQQERGGRLRKKPGSCRMWLLLPPLRRRTTVSMQENFFASHACPGLHLSLPPLHTSSNEAPAQFQKKQKYEGTCALALNCETNPMHMRTSARGFFPLPRPFCLRQVFWLIILQLFARWRCVCLPLPLRSGKLHPPALPPHLIEICCGRGHPLVVSS